MAAKKKTQKEITAEAKALRCIKITNAEWGTREENAGLFDVTFHGLTESQVRELAAKVKP